jgi:hypothetical protein
MFTDILQLIVRHGNVLFARALAPAAAAAVKVKIFYGWVGPNL